MGMGVTAFIETPVGEQQYRTFCALLLSRAAGLELHALAGADGNSPREKMTHLSRGVQDRHDED